MKYLGSISDSKDLVNKGYVDDSIEAGLEAVFKWLGVTTTSITDGSSTNPIIINNESVTAVEGSVVGYNNSEFLFDGSNWKELGKDEPIAFESFSGPSTITTATTFTYGSYTYYKGYKGSVISAFPHYTGSSFRLEMESSVPTVPPTINTYDGYYVSYSSGGTTYPVICAGTGDESSITSYPLYLIVITTESGSKYYTIYSRSSNNTIPAWTLYEENKNKEIIIEQELKEDSTNLVTNGAVAKNINGLNEEVGELKSSLSALSGLSTVHFTEGGYISTSGETVDFNTVTPNSFYRYAVLNCEEGDKFTVNGEGGSIPRLWCFIDISGNVLSNAADTEIATNLVLTAPTNAAKLIINDKKSGGVCYTGVAYTIPDVVSDLTERIDTESAELDALKAVTTIDSYETVAFDSEETGTAYNTDNTSGTVWSGAHSFIKAVTPGEKYSISTTVIANTKYYAVMYYNGTTYVSGEVQGISGTQQEIADHDFVIPTGVNRIIVCTYTATTPVLQKIMLAPYIDTAVGGTVPNYVIYDGTTLTVKCRYNATEDLVVQLKKRGNNNLFDFDKIFTCSRSDVLDANVSPARSILTANTDCFSPHQVRAKSNADGDSSDVFLTGGNHNHSDVATAICTGVSVYVDGVKTISFSGLCSHIRVEWTNLIQGYNTWKSNGTGRAILQEDIILDISGSTFEASVKQTALEDIYQAVYYGLQSINTPYSTILFVGGANRMAEAISTARNSGDLKARRTLAINSNTHDALETYVNPEDLGSFDFTGATYSIFTANNKCYYAIMRDQSVEMAEDEVYCLFGHYRFWSES